MKLRYKQHLLSMGLLALFFGCKSSERRVYGINKNGFVESFKTMSFCKCVEVGNNKKFIFGDDDVSCRYPDWLYSEGDVIDSLALAEARKIKLDSIESAQYSVAEGMEGKHVISHCLKFYQSKELDVIAIRRFKK